MMLGIKFLLLILSVLIGYFVGYLLTEKYPLSKYRVFQFTLFECRKCFSFHIAWTTSTFISLLFNDYIMLLIGIFFAFMLFIGLRIDERNKTITLEEFDKIN